MRQALALALLVSLLSIASDARAHPLGFAVVSITETSPRELAVVVRISGTESDPGHIVLGWPEGCVERVTRDTMDDEVRERRSLVVCEADPRGHEVAIDGPSRGLEVLFESELAHVAPARVVVRALPARVTLGASESLAVRVRAEARLGALHFALGIDHLLFVLGAFFLVRERGLKAVTIAVTAFTIGHAVTLALATLGAWIVPTRPVEACIALSLVHVARELRVEASTLTRRVPAVACGLFGLVHGAGLASAMSSAGLSGADLAASVASFNVGLELAELALVLVAFAIARGRLGERLERGAPWVIGGVGAWLLVERLIA